MRALLALILIPLFLGAAPAWCGPAPKVVLMTSIARETGRPLLYSGDWDFHARIESVFRERMDPSGFQIEVIREADLEDIWRVLHDPQVVGAFYVAHAANTQAPRGVLQASAKIADHRDYDVAGAFQSVHPKLKFLAVVGCATSELFKKYRENGYFSENNDLVIKTFSETIKAVPAWVDLNQSSGLHEALDASLPVLGTVLRYEDLSRSLRAPCFSARGDYSHRRCRERAERTQPMIMKPEFAHWDASPSAPLTDGVTIERRIPAHVAPESVMPVLVEAQGRVLTFFPRGKPGETQTRVISARTLPAEITIQSGVGYRRKKSETTLGEFNFYARGASIRLEVLRSRLGEPLGVGSHLYRSVRD